MVGITIKKHVRNGELTLAVCDTELLGKEFEEGKTYLDLSSSFYQGKEESVEKVREHIQAARNATIVGVEAVEAVKEVLELNVRTVQNIPYAIIVKA